MASRSNLVFSLKSLLISTAVLSIAVLMKFSVPLIVDFAVYEVPVVWSTLISWLKPPYLYVIINGIIITIAASSRFHQMFNYDDENQSEPLVKSKASPSYQPSDFDPVSATPEIGIVELPANCESEPPRVLEVNPVVVNGGDEDEYVIPRSTWSPPQSINYLEAQTEYIFPATEKPLVSSRFGHRKPVKASPEGESRALRVAKPKRTLENTWKTITDGRHMPLTRHLRKSDTCENHGRQLRDDHQSPQKVTKSETFRDRTNYGPTASPSPGSGKLKKEASLSQDELNRRVEAFIKKFNEEMRLQRQESLNQYKKIVG